MKNTKNVIVLILPIISLIVINLISSTIEHVVNVASTIGIIDNILLLLFVTMLIWPIVVPILLFKINKKMGKKEICFAIISIVIANIFFFIPDLYKTLIVNGSIDITELQISIAFIIISMLEVIITICCKQSSKMYINSPRRVQ